MNHHKIIVMSKLLQRTCLSSLNYTAAAEIHSNNVTTTTSFSRQQRLSLSSSQIQSIPLRNSDSMTTAFACKRFYSKFSSQQHPTTSLGAVPPLCEEKAYELVLALKDAERSSLKMALDKYDALKLKEGFEAEKAQPPSSSDLYKIFFVNAVPFVVFGFLDNFCMIMAGDYIEQVCGAFMCISTMAAAGLGNTISDILGIGTAFYVERFCAFLGLRPPDLVPIQMEMKESRRAANSGRIIGITIGCLLGMFPLLFLNNEKSEETDQSANPVATVI
ncbi:transmembrane protein 65 isoform X2 [Episyrphus balteatus]|uniref:transmembrane protein 65 isoform X2 n=1 Tax=Episyrphus balteatus TaxID=286459 RepID=UPI0024862276|nr:transmembrane protein 65 isoform X2 [Episyrphus balteatus]